MSELREVCPVIAFMVQQATAEQGVESDFLGAVDDGDIHICGDLEPVQAPGVQAAKRVTPARLPVQVPFVDLGYGEWATLNLR